MIKLLNAILVCCVLAGGFVLYSLEHETRGLEREIAKTQKAISDEREQTKMLNAEWASLTRPDRLQKIAEEQLNLKSVTASQIVKIEDLPSKVPDQPVVKLEAQNSDPIGAILEKMQ
jgi:cell division protein FtsL